MMNTFVCLASLATVAMLGVALLPLTSSATPLGPVIDPVIALEEMEAYHACLFICHNCFVRPDDPLWALSVLSPPIFEHFHYLFDDKEKMMRCSNQVCGSLYEEKCAFEQFMWLGHNCRHFGGIEGIWSSAAKKRSHGGVKRSQYNLK